eukprot:6204201-Pleurochrysis_carterae.AAC.8
MTASLASVQINHCPAATLVPAARIDVLLSRTTPRSSVRRPVPHNMSNGCSSIENVHTTEARFSVDGYVTYLLRSMRGNKLSLACGCQMSTTRMRRTLEKKSNAAFELRSARCPKDRRPSVNTRGGLSSSWRADAALALLRARIVHSVLKRVVKDEASAYLPLAALATHHDEWLRPLVARHYEWQMQS